MAKRLVEIELGTSITFPAALNHYSQNFDYDDSKRWALLWLEKRDSGLAETLSGIDPQRFSNRGYVCRLMDRGMNINEKTVAKVMQFFHDMLTEKKHISQLSPEPVEKKPGRPPQPRINTIIYQMDGALDDILSDKEPENIEIPADKKMVTESREWCEKELVNLQEHLSKSERMYDLVVSVYGRCGGIIDGLKRRRNSAPRKASTRANKSKDMFDALKTIKYQKEDTDLGLKGQPPSAIIDAKSVLVYNTKTRTMFNYQAPKSGVLGVKGASITGFDQSLSSKKTIRKPMDFFRSGNYVKEYDSLKTVAKPLSHQPRMNEQSIIVKVTK